MLRRMTSLLAGALVLACVCAVAFGAYAGAVAAIPFVAAAPPLILLATSVLAVVTVALGYRSIRRAGLSLFSRTSDRYTFNLATFHSPHSLTWSWGVSFILPRSAGEGRWLGAWTYLNNGGRQFGFQIMRCQLTFSRQRPMFYRSLWQRENEAYGERMAAAR